MTPDDLITLARQHAENPGCARCSMLRCKGWESLPGEFDRSTLRQSGSLRDPEEYEPTPAEYHPKGTHNWSADAPIAPGWFPYNLCDVWQCVGCGKPFLRYTEVGGYYSDERIRELQLDLIDTSSNLD